MKKLLTVLAGIFVFCAPNGFAQTQKTIRCGVDILHKAMIAKDPSWEQRLKDQRASLQAQADNYRQNNAGNNFKKTTTASPVPVIFHIVVDSAQFVQMGSTAGIIKRCDSQIAVLNRDYNMQNSDSTLIPSSWKPLYGNVGIHFGLAHTRPDGHYTPGFEILIVSATQFSDVNAAYVEAKTAGTGLPAWDLTKYFNVWCINFAPLSGGGTLLGITVPLSQTSFYPAGSEGVCLLYTALGTSTSGAGTFSAPYNLGRTLTHETGHFFEIWHPWGDDNGLCPWNGGSDDGLADTPPEADATYGNPAFTITGGTINDGCKMNGSTNMQPIGIACISYMDYTDDNAMHLFTLDQAATMAAQVAPGGENFTLTQNPDLLNPPASVASKVIDNSLNIFPNPTTGQLNISFNSSAETLDNIVIMNMLGQTVAIRNNENVDYYSIDLSGMSRGIYFVKCNFASGSVTRKILLQ